jgi:multiple sugar transport system permease protein
METDIIQNTPSVGTVVKKRRGMTRRQRKILTFYLFISPWLIGFIFLGLIPLILGLLTSVTNYDGLNFFNLKFVGMRNYARAMNDSEVVFSAGRTLWWLVFNLPLWMGLSFGMALILNQAIKGRGIFRTLYYLPSIVPAAAAIVAWKVILDKNNGLLNGLISIFRPGTAIGWLSDYSMAGMTTIAVWTGLGVGMIIFLAGLQGIPNELLEAANIDGANGWQSFRHITLPLMTPVIFFQLILGLIGAFSQLNMPLLLVNVGLSGSGAVPSREIYLYMVNAYYEIFTNQRFAYGTALLWMLFAGVLLVTIFVFWTEKYWVYSDQPQQGGES